MCISDSATCKALFSLTNCLLNPNCQSQNVTLIRNFKKVTNRERYSLYTFFFSQFFSKATTQKQEQYIFFPILLHLTGHTTTHYLSPTTYKYLLTVQVVCAPVLNLGPPLVGWWRYLHHLGDGGGTSTTSWDECMDMTSSSLQKKRQK